MPPRWGYGSPAREAGLGCAQGVVCALSLAVAFWACVFLLIGWGF
jgi:hypothetical protein